MTYRRNRIDGLQFEESVSDSPAREFVAFANSGGGRVYLGVADDRSVKGARSDDRSLALMQDVARHCDRQPRTLVELLERAGRSDRTKFRVAVLGPPLEAGLIALTVPDKPRSRFQEYRLTGSGEERLYARQE